MASLVETRFFSPKYRVNSHKTTSVPSLQERAWQESMKASGRCDIQRHFPETFPWMKPKHPTCKHPVIVFSIQAVTCENGWFAKKNRGKNCKNSSQSPRKTGKKTSFWWPERVKGWNLDISAEIIWESIWNPSKLKILLPQTVIFFCPSERFMVGNDGRKTLKSFSFKRLAIWRVSTAVLG